jgi:CDP-glycerol glycerophosphotransferase
LCSILRCVFGSVLARLISVKPNFLIFGSRGGVAFEGNAKYLYLYALKISKFKCVWIAKNMEVVREVRAAGGVAYHYLSLKGFVASAQASGIFLTHSMFDTVPLIWKKNQKLVDLWHGAPLKKVAFEDKNLGFIVRMMDHYKKRRVNYLISHSESANDIYSLNFQINPDRIKGYGSPKIEYCRDNAACSDSVYSKFSKAFLYLPTFRDYPYEIPLLKPSVLMQVNALLKSRNEYLVIKLHPSEKKIDIEDLSNIEIWESKVDIYNELAKFDILISDYSSLLTEFKSIDPEKSVVVYAPDLKRYTQCRGFNAKIGEVFGNIIEDDYLRIFNETSEVLDNRFLPTFSKSSDKILSLVSS